MSRFRLGQNVHLTIGGTDVTADIINIDRAAKTVTVNYLDDEIVLPFSDLRPLTESEQRAVEDRFVNQWLARRNAGYPGR